MSSGRELFLAKNNFLVTLECAAFHVPLFLYAHYSHPRSALIARQSLKRRNQTGEIREIAIPVFHFFRPSAI
jgi:hypothetical protein